MHWSEKLIQFIRLVLCCPITTVIITTLSSSTKIAIAGTQTHIDAKYMLVRVAGRGVYSGTLIPS